MNKKTLFLIPLLLTLLTVPYLTVQIQTVQASFQGSFESLPRYYEASMPYSYLVTENGTHAFMFNGTTHQMEASGTNRTQIINWAFSNVTSQARNPAEKVVILGNHTIDSSLKVHPHTNVHWEAEIYLAEGSNCHMIQNGNATGQDVTFTGNLLLYGTKDYDDTEISDGIHWNPTASNPDGDIYQTALTLDLDSLRIEKMSRHGIFANSTGDYRYDFKNILEKDIDDYGVCFMPVSDSRLTNSWLTGDVHNLYMNGGAGNYFNDLYCGGGASDAVMRVIGGHGHIYDNCRWDNTISDHAIRFTGACKSHQIIGGKVTSTTNLDADDTYCGISIEDTSHNITIVGTYIGCKTNISPSKLFKYGIQELDSANDNHIRDCHVANNRGSISLLGVDSTAYGCQGYNPYGNVTSCVSSSYLITSNSGGTIQDNTEYTVAHSPKAIFMQDGSTFDVYVNGELVFNGVSAIQVIVYPSETFKIDHDGTMDTLSVYAQ